MADKKIGAVLVVGGGIAGMQSSLDLANSGFKVYMLDTSPAIGGTMAQLDKTFPTNDCSMCIMAPKLVDVGRHPNIELLTYSDLEGVSGEEGNFTVKVRKKARYVDVNKCTGCGVCAKECPIDAISGFNEGLSKRQAIYLRYPQAVPLAFTIDRDKCIGCGLCETLCLADAILYEDEDAVKEINVGSIILCPGFEEFNADIKGEYGHGRFPNVVSSIEFERILSATGPYKGHVQRPSDGDLPDKVAFIQCVGSRDRTCGNNYCSSVCCTYAIKEAVIAKEHVNTIQPTIFFMDMRTYGKGFEEYYNRAKDEYGVRFIRCRVPEVREDPETNNLIIKYEREDGEFVEEEFQMVVLSVGFEADEKSKELASRLGIELN
ncbi:MAG: CoB--CoM heterodisulfide reductase iron-sulfur subunit A family protein, partial [Thermoplasmata archaeon]|nr:CoB--CoM heterodisulfide reductase iron-sulfur subunit A family protein [Thermoplasmata archaeon]